MRKPLSKNVVNITKGKKCARKRGKNRVTSTGLFSAKKLGVFDHLLIQPEKAISGNSVILNNREYSVN